MKLHASPFHVGMAAVFAAIALASFIPTYWAKLAAGTFGGAPIVHLHGLLFFSWMCFYLVQTSLARNGRTQDHRAWGLAGIALFSVMMCTIVALAIEAMNKAEQAGFADAGRAFAAVTFSTLAKLIVLFTLAIATTRRPQIHQRLMVVLMVVLLEPAIARVFALLFAPPGATGPPPVISAIPTAAVAELLVVIAIVHDWRTRGRPHWVYVGGSLIIVGTPLLLVPFASSAAWMSTARALQSLMG